MHSLPLELTAPEVLFLSDRIQNSDQDEGRAIAKPFLLKLGSAYLEMVHADRPRAGTISIWVTEPEAWLARSKFTSSGRCDAEPKLGIEMLRKVYTILLAFQAPTDAWPDAAEGDRRYDDSIVRIQEAPYDDGDAQSSHS